MNGLTNRLLAALGAIALLALAAAAPGVIADPPEHAQNGNSQGNGNSEQGDPQPEYGNEPDNAHGQQELAEPKTPERGESVNAKPEKGEVKVKLPGSDKAIDLSEASSLPVGTVVDTRSGSVKIVAASLDGDAQFATFTGAVFKIIQPRNSDFTDIRLVGKRIAPCAPRGSAVASARRPVRRLWASGRGRFSTHGNDSVATVRGTTWMTADTCRGTLVRVRRGVVDVRDLVRKRTVVVRTGEQYLAKRR